jgi:8-amino-7-oxononanoate synthase
VYSMDGDECPLVKLTNLAAKYDASIILDEAHSTGIFGEKGAGLAVSLGVEKRIDIRMYTFGKAMGCHGACVAGSKLLIDYLINFSRPFIYTTALPPHSIVSINSSFDFLQQNIHLQHDLTKNINLFTSLMKGSVPLIKSRSAIQAVLRPGNEQSRDAASRLQKSGFDVRPILSPTVAAGEERLRICLHVYNTEKEISELSQVLKNLITN